MHLERETCAREFVCDARALLTTEAGGMERERRVKEGREVTCQRLASIA